MAKNENPLGIFPFSKEQLEVLLANGTLVDAAQKYYRNAARLLHPDQGGKDFVDYGLPADGVFKVLNGAFQQIESADASQLEAWVKNYGNGSGVSEDTVARILRGAEVLRDRLQTAQAENTGLERRLHEMVSAIGRGQHIPESRLREILAGRGGADPAEIRQLQAQLAESQRQYQLAQGNFGAAVRDRDAVQQQARNLNTELNATRREKLAKQREADGYKDERDVARQQTTDVQTAATNLTTELSRQLEEARLMYQKGLMRTIRDSSSESSMDGLSLALTVSMLPKYAPSSREELAALVNGAQAYFRGEYETAERCLSIFRGIQNGGVESRIGTSLLGLAVRAENQGPDGKPLNLERQKWAEWLLWTAEQQEDIQTNQIQDVLPVAPDRFMKGLIAYLRGEYSAAEEHLEIYNGIENGGLSDAVGMYFLSLAVRDTNTTEDGLVIQEDKRARHRWLAHTAHERDANVSEKAGRFVRTPVALENFGSFDRGRRAFESGNYALAEEQLKLFRGREQGGKDDAAGMYLLAIMVNAHKERGSTERQEWYRWLKWKATERDPAVPEKIKRVFSDTLGKAVAAYRTGDYAAVEGLSAIFKSEEKGGIDHAEGMYLHGLAIQAQHPSDQRREWAKWLVYKAQTIEQGCKERVESLIR